MPITSEEFGTTVEDGWEAYEDAVLTVFSNHPDSGRIKEACHKAFYAGGLHAIFLVFRGLGVETRDGDKTVIAYNLNDLAKAIEQASQVQGEVGLFAASINREGATIN